VRAAEELEAAPETPEAVEAETDEEPESEPKSEVPEAESELAEPEAAAAAGEEDQVLGESDVDAQDRTDKSEAEPDAKPDVDGEKTAEETPADDNTTASRTVGSFRRRLSVRLRNRRGR
jgi:hypothetical protein